MKQQFLFFLFIFIGFNSFSQFIENSKDKLSINQPDYYTKSENQKSAGWVLLGVGTVCTVGGFLMSNDKNINHDKNFGFGDSFDSETFLIVGGAILASASVPFFIAAHANKLKAKSISARININQIENHSLFKTKLCYPSLSININW